MAEDKPFLNVHDFRVTEGELSAMFDMHTIREGLSDKKLRQLGGAEGLCERLMTNLKSGISTNKAALESRILA